MLRTGLVTVLLMGLGSTAMASDRVRVFVDYNSGGYYHVGHHYNERGCRDGRHWVRRDGWNRHYRSPPRYYGYNDYYRRPPGYGWNSWSYTPSYSWGLSWDSGRNWDRGRRDHGHHWDRDDRRDHWNRGDHRGWDRGRDRDWHNDRDRDRDRDWDRGRDHDRYHH